MACFTKSRITTNLLQVALLLLYLRGDFPISYNQRNNYNISSPEYNLGPSWGYAQTNFHRNSYDGISVHPKSIHSFEQNYLDYSDNDIFDVIRSHSLNSFRSRISAITKVSDTVPSFQNVTAYLLSNTSATFPNLPLAAPVDRDQLLSVNVDVPRSNDENERNDTTTSSEIYLTTEDESGSHFHLISGNIVFLPEAESEEEVDSTEQVLAHPLINSNDESSIGEATIDVETTTEEASASSSQSTANAENVADKGASSWSSSSFPDAEPTEHLWDQLQNDMGQLLDEDFSLGLAFDDEMLAMGDVLAAETAQNRFVDDSGDDELTMTAIPPMSLHYDELWDTDSGIFDTLLEISPDDQSSAAALLNDLESGVIALSEESESGPSSPDLSEDLNNILIQAVEESGQSSSGSIPETSDEEGSDLIEGLEMIQTASIYANARPTSHPAQQRSFVRMQGLLRGSNMDQRWQELASLLSLPQHDPNGAPLPPPLPHPFPPHHHHHHLHHPTSSLHHHSMHHPPFSSAGPPAVHYPDTTRSVLLQNASLPVPPPEINTNSSYPNVGMGPPPNLGSALASSMHITNSSDPMIDPSSHYKMIEPPHEMLYYPNMTSNAEMSNQTTEGFLSSILNEDDLQLMDMAMNEGMYQMRPMDSASGAVGNPGAAGLGVGIHQGLPHQSNCSIGAASVVNVSSTVHEDRMEASSDSAVSSMGSERVPPMTDPHISDNEWTDPDHPHSSHDSNYTSDYASKLRGYDYYGKGDGIHRVGAPVAQKKHQMFGKRVQHDQGVHPYSLGPHASGLCVSYPSASGVHQPNPGAMDSLEMKYSCSVDFVRHDADGRTTDGPAEIHNNHSYSLPQSHLPNSTLSLRSQRPPTKEKSKMAIRTLAEEYLSRDEKRARALNLPLTTDDIINLPMDEFNERLSKYDLTESQLSLIRDIRRRGKNKVAAQNCRKRKLDQILQLAEEVQRIRDKKIALMRDQENLMARRNEIREKYLQLYRTVFQALKDPAGNPYSPLEWSLQQAADGNMILVPRNSYQPSTSGTSESINSSIRRGKTKDEIKKDGQA